MVDKVDMSLDDIIKSNRSSFKTGRGAARGGRGGPRRGGARGGGRGARSGGPSSPRKSFSTGAGRKFAPKGPPAARNSNSSNGASGDRWQHDKFRGPSAAGTGASKLTISNLHYGVSDADIRELFNEFGALKKAAVHYDRSGRSLGTADVIFERRADALRAMKQYNDVPLDGRPMQIELVGDKPSTGAAAAGPKVLAGRIGKKPAGPRAPSGNPRPQQVKGAARGGRGGAGAGRGRGAKRAPSKKTPTKEELDAELDAYVSKMDTA